MKELANELQKLVGYEVAAVIPSEDDDVQVQFSNEYGVSVNLIFEKDGITITDPYAPCHMCCERHGCEHDQDDDGVEWDEDADEFYDIGYDDGYNVGYNDALKSNRKGERT